MINRECGVFHTTYEADHRLFRVALAQGTLAGIVVVLYLVFPWLANEYLLSVANLVAIAAVGAIGLNILVGYTGQISIGHGAFMSVGAYAAANLATRAGLPFWICLPAGGLTAALAGLMVGVPSLRIKGLYLAIATLAAQFIIEWTINHVPWISGGTQASIQVPRPSFAGFTIASQRRMYYFILVVATLAVAAAFNLFRTRVGRAFVAVRDQDVAAKVIGINIFRYKLLAFALSSFYAGITGVLYTYYLGIANYEQFTIVTSINYLAMVVIGGLGSVVGSIFGAAFITLLPILLRYAVEGVGGLFFTVTDVLNLVSNVQLVLFGGLIILFLVLEPEGLYKLYRSVRDYFRVWPLAY